MIQSTSQQKKKQCSSPLSTCGDKTSVCSTPSLSPIKNEPLIQTEKSIRHETSTPLFRTTPATGQYSPLLRVSTSTSSVHNSSRKAKNETSSDDTSLLSFERHELSAGNATMMTNNDHEEIPNKATTDADWSYFVTVSDTNFKGLEKPSPPSSFSSSSCSSSSAASVNREGSQVHPTHVGCLEFFIDGKSPQDPSIRKFHPSVSSIHSSLIKFFSSSCSTTISSICSPSTSCRFSCHQSKTCGRNQIKRLQPLKPIPNNDKNENVRNVCKNN